MTAPRSTGFTWRARPCPICGSARPANILGRRDAALPTRHGSVVFAHVDGQCPDCGGLFSVNAPDQDGLNQFYRDGFCRDSDLVEIEPDYDAAARLRLIQAAVPAGGTIIEVGASRGEFCRTLAAHGYRAIGIDPLASADPALVSDQLPDGQADAVISYLVVEHLIDPAGWLHDLARRLKPGGTLILEAPDVLVDPVSALNPEHLQHLTADHLRLMVSRCGFDAPETGAGPGSRGFAFAIVATRGAAAADVSALADRCRQGGAALRAAYDAAMARLAAFDAHAARVARDVADRAPADVVVWAANDYATRVGMALAGLGIDQVRLVDNARTKIGARFDGFAEPVQSPGQVRPAEGRHFIICSQAWFDDILQTIVALGASPENIHRGVPVNSLEEK